MDSYLLEWLSLLLRWAHVAVAIAWIGASFYFIWLDNHLEQSPDPKLAGELWAIHGGGFYRAEKFRLAPTKMPRTLHWFKWEAYWTWITGFFLLVLVYYAGAEIYLVDPSIMALSKSQAIGIGVGSLIVGLAVYEGLCRSPLGNNETHLAVVLFLLLAATAWGLCQLFGGRGAFIHYGAILGTIMVGNVAHVIIPGQRRIVAALAAGREPDPRDGAMGKQRSVHNTYFTLPVLFTMIASHHAFTFGSRWSWLVLVALTAAGALIRVWFVMRHKGAAPALPLAAGLAVLFILFIVLLPRQEAGSENVKFGDIKGIIDSRCLGCHSPKPGFPGLNEPPKGVLLDTPERIRTQAGAILAQTVVSKAMPPGNVTAMTEEERGLIGAWIRLGARIE